MPTGAYVHGVLTVNCQQEPHSSTNPALAKQTALRNLQMINLARKIEFIANVSIIIVAMLLVIVLTKQYLIRTTQGETPIVDSRQSRIGSKTAALNINWSQNGQTLLLAISSTCRYCTESAVFYQRVVNGNTNTTIVAVMPQTADDARKYLDDQKIRVNEIRQASLESLGVTGTPTLILVDGNGIVTGWWVGKLSTSQETDVLHRLHV